MNHFLRIFWSGCLLMMVVAGLAACALTVENQPAAPVVVTIAPIVVLPTETAVPAETAAPIPTETIAPTATPLPPETVVPHSTEPPLVTPTPAAPQITLNTDLNVRSGPGTDYARLGLLKAGTTAIIVGQSATGGWWQITFTGSADGLGWLADGYGVVQNADGVPVVEVPPTPTPAVPSATPIPAATPVPPSPTPPAIDYVVSHVRLRTNEENGGYSPGGSVDNCGYGHDIYVQVIDAAGNPLDGAVIGDIYNNPRQISGSKGPGRAEYNIFGNGYQLLVVEDIGAGRPVTSEVSPSLTGKDEEIPIPWLIEAHYCATPEECATRVGNNTICRGHYSWDITFKRTW